MRQIITYYLREDGTLAIVVREPSNAAYCTGNPVPDKVTMEIYAANKSGDIVLEETVVGTHHPARRIPESFEFPS